MRKFGFYVAIIFALVFSGCSSSDSGGGTTGTSGTTITAVDGYIKDANITDANGQVATYSGVGGKYTFSSSPVYPLTSTGGSYEDTNASFDINMTCSSGTVISPITTFLENNSTVLAKLANLGLSGNPAALSDFSVDYINTNNTDLAKLAQLLYAVQKDANLTKTLRSDMNVSSLNTLYTHIESDINTTITDTTLNNNMRLFIQKVRDINSSVSLANYEVTLKTSKQYFSSITWKGKTYGQVISPFTGKVWLDRNLGASRVATAYNDAQSYGDYYQWGRGADGHQESNSTTTATLATDINASNANGSFIKKGASPYDWTTADANGSLRTTAWSKTDGTSICPVGYRVPTIAELTAETINASTAVTNPTDAFNNFLKLPTAGYRLQSDGGLNQVASRGFVWSSSALPNSYSSYLDFVFGPGGGSASQKSDVWAKGFSVRCLRN